MTTVALISDIHANLAALIQVLRRIKALGVEQIGCLGDIVGYGPNPLQCLRLIMKHASFSIVGNHDAAVRCGEWEKFNYVAADATEWTKRQILEAPDADQLMGYLVGLPSKHLMHSTLIVHGSPRDPVDEYIFPREADPEDSYYDPLKMHYIFEAFEGRWCFVGHTHQPGVFFTQNGNVTFTPASEFPDGFTLPEGTRAIVNVGSVGQPRDGDARACFATVDGYTVRWHRVYYAVSNTVRRIRTIPALAESLAVRLELGK